jgi:hypothetical protein
MRENNSLEKVTYMGNVQGPEKVNDTCLKTMHVGTMDRGFTVLILIITTAVLCLYHERVLGHNIEEERYIG